MAKTEEPNKSLSQSAVDENTAPPHGNPQQANDDHSTAHATASARRNSHTDDTLSCCSTVKISNKTNMEDKAATLSSCQDLMHPDWSAICKRIPWDMTSNEMFKDGHRALLGRVPRLLDAVGTMANRGWWTHNFYDRLMTGAAPSTDSTQTSSDHHQSASSPKGVMSLTDPVPSELGGSSMGESLSSFSTNSASQRRPGRRPSTADAAIHGRAEAKVEVKADDQSDDDNLKPAAHPAPELTASSMSHQMETIVAMEDDEEEGDDDDTDNVLVIPGSGASQVQVEPAGITGGDDDRGTHDQTEDPASAQADCHCCIVL